MSKKDIEHRIERLEKLKGVKNQRVVWVIQDGDVYEVNGEKMTKAELEAKYSGADDVLLRFVEIKRDGEVPQVRD